MTEYVITRYGVEVDLSYEHKCGCPRCISKGGDNSGDNLHCYGVDSTGHRGAYCHACGYTIPSEEWLEENAEEPEGGYEYVGSLFNDEIHAKLKENTTTNSMNFRNIRADTCAYFGVRHEYDPATGTMVSQLYPCTIDNKLSGYKRRILPKDFSKPIGETGKGCELFGQFRFKKSNQNTVLIVGGEVDQLSAFQMLDDYDKSKNGGEYEKRPVVSPTIGESGANKQIQAQYEWFNRFDKIIICMDNDEAGEAATEAIAKVLPKGKAYIMSMTLKDPNEYLKNNRAKEFVSAYFSAKPYSPSGIVGSSSLGDAIRQAINVDKIPLPGFMHVVQGLMAGGIPLGVLVNLGSASGTGKSTIADECVYHWIFNCPHRVGIVSLEADKAQYGINILSRHVGIKFNLIEDIAYKNQLLDSPEIKAKEYELWHNPDGTDRFHLVDDRDGGIEDLKEQVMKLIVMCDCKVIILDPLQDILDGLSNDEQAVFLRWIKGLLKSHGVTFICINHVRKSGSGGTQNSQGADIHEEDFQGSSSIFKSAACNLLFRRNKEAESEIERNTTIMKMTKCRWTGRTSPSAGKYFCSIHEHKMYDLNDYIEKNPSMRQEFEDAA